MNITSKRGVNQTKIRDVNRLRIWDYFKANPGATQMDAAEALDLNRNSVSSHVRAIRAGWKPEAVAKANA